MDKPIEEIMNTIKNPPEFEDWLFSCLEDILHVKGLLRIKLPTELTALKQDISDCVSWYERMTSLLADADAYLDIAEDYNIELKSKELTDFDRKLRLAAKCALERKLRNKLEGIVNGIEKRISLGQSILSFEKQTKPYLQEG